MGPDGERGAVDGDPAPVEGAADRLARSASDARLTLWARVRELPDGLDVEYDLRWAINMLERESRDRIRKMHDSINAGRVDDVISHLRAYFAAHQAAGTHHL